MSQPDVSSSRKGEIQKTWEHAWTIDEMRKASGNWNLASDTGLLLHLQEFSQKLLSETHEIQDQVNSLNHETKLTNVRLNNVFNDFIMLANTQFMENRVYDEEVVAQEQTDGNKTQEEKEKTQQQREAELIPKIKQAISFGLNVFDTAYEKLDMNVANSDSEDEDVTNKSSIILEPKDPYLCRPLPCLIGSHQFFHSDDLGLATQFDEKEDEEIDDVLIDDDIGKKEAVPVTSFPPPPAKVDTISETESEETSDDGDLFGTETKKKNETKIILNKENFESEDESLDHSAKKPAIDLQSELASRIGASNIVGEQKKHSESFEKEVSPQAKRRSSKTKTKPFEGEALLFGNSSEDPSDDIFSRPSGLFSSRPATLFDDDDDEEENGGLFGLDSKRTKQEKNNTTNSDKPTSQVHKPVAESGPSGKQEPKQTTKAKSLFSEDEDEEEEDLFAAKPSQAKSQPKEVKKSGLGLFEDEEEEEETSKLIFDGKSSSSQIPTEEKPPDQKKFRVPAGAVSIFGGGDDFFKAAVKKQKKETSDETANVSYDDNSFSKPSTMAKSLKPPGAAEALKQTESSSPSTMSSSSLFTEDPEMFIPTTKPKTVAAKESNSTSKTKASFSLFSGTDDAEDDDLFASLGKPISAATKISSENKKKATRLLFEDEDDNDGGLFDTKDKQEDKKKISLVEDIEKKKPEVENKPTDAKESTKQNKSKVSLFDDNSGDENDLFSTISSTKKSPSKVKHAAADLTSGAAIGRGSRKPSLGASMFSDEDLFFSTSDDSPTVDLFKTTSTNKTESKPDLKVDNGVKDSKEPIVKKETIKEPSKPMAKLPSVEPSKAKATTAEPLKVKGAGTSLFGGIEDDEEDDLFSLAHKKTSQKSNVSSSNAKTTQVTLKTEDDLFGSPLKEHLEEDLFDGSVGSEVKKLAVERSSKIDPSKTESYVDPLNSTNEKQEIDSLFGSNKQSEKKTPEEVTPTSPKVLPKSSAKSNRISMLQASMNIDPTSHLPHQEKKKDKETVTTSNDEDVAADYHGETTVVADYDLPTQTQTLKSLSKDRAKIPGKRRPPTRKHSEQEEKPKRKDSANNNLSNENPIGDDLFSVRGTNILNSKEKSSNLESKLEINKDPKKSQSVDVPDSKTNITKENTEKEEYKIKTMKEDDKTHVTKTVEEKSKAKTKEEDSKIEMAKEESRKTTKREDLIFSSHNRPPPLPMDDDDDDDDDLFGGSKIKSNKGIESKNSTKATYDMLNKKQSEAKNKSLTKTLVDDNDIFAGSSLLSSSSSKEKTKETSKIFKMAHDDDDSDLFGTRGLLFSADASKKNVGHVQKLEASEKEKSTAQASVMEDRSVGSSEKLLTSSSETKNSANKPTEKIRISSDEDDIFSLPKNIPSSKVRTEPKTKAIVLDDDDIFSSSIPEKRKSQTTKPKLKTALDDDDIFAVVPPPSFNQTKNQVHSTDHKKEKPYLEDDDDLFASSSSTHRTNSRPAYKKPVTKDEDLFKDDTDIFADIPATKPKDKKTAKDVKSQNIHQSKDDFDDIFDDPLNVMRN